MHPAHLLLVALVLAGVAGGALALVWAWRTSGDPPPEAPADHSLLTEFVRRDREDPEAARRWLEETLGRPGEARRDREPGSDG
ncbi:MAG TPA: hypothetical protein VFK09_04380 [Gemmatimonadales bacterium]|nr:hypothetical protein [Gemmatimonadales bacterium]